MAESQQKLTPGTTKLAPGKALAAYLKQCKHAVAQLPRNPFSTNSGHAVRIPHYDAMHKAAKRVDSLPQHKKSDVPLLIQELLGRGSSVDVDQPTFTDMVFPKVHHLSPKMGKEWYWIGIKFPVRNANGQDGEVAILHSLQKSRVVGKQVQADANWDDRDTLVFGTVSTASVRIGGYPAHYVRRNQNTSWGRVTPVSDMSYSDGACGKEPFSFINGPDKMYSLNSDPTLTEILPVRFIIDEQDSNKTSNGNFTCTFDVSVNSEVDPTHGWCNQGLPTAIGAGGTGITLAPSPGLYYSWPHLVGTASGNFVLGGEVYTVTGPGTGWMDHQMMFPTLLNGPVPAVAPVQPIPYLQDVSPVNGWQWMFCNYYGASATDLRAYTQCSFQQGSAHVVQLSPYGYDMRLDPTTHRFVGKFEVAINVINPATGTPPVNYAPAGAVPGPTNPYVSTLNIDTSRVYLRNALTPQQETLVAVAWDPTATVIPGDFNNPSWTVASEYACDYLVTTADQGLASLNASPLRNTSVVGWGYAEAVGVENTLATTTRLLHYLKHGPPANVSGRIVGPVVGNEAEDIENDNDTEEVSDDDLWFRGPQPVAPTFVSRLCRALSLRRHAVDEENE